MYRQVLAALAVVLTIGAGGAPAEAPKPFTEFEAKRIKVPGARTGVPVNPAKKRITVQIDPEEQAKRLAALPPHPSHSDASAPEPIESSDPGAYAWFWESVSPDAAEAGPGRLEPALRALSASGKVRAPRLQQLQDILREQGAAILRSTIGTRVSPALVLAVISVESSGKSDALSPAGAAGLMQLMPDTAERFGVSERNDPLQSIQGGVKYLDWLMAEFGGDPMLVLAGYNAGEGAVRRNGGVPPYAETRDYVPKVLAAFRVARGLCSTPPELISDGCAFANMN